ncbi:MAG: bifunctional phosphopantothenoylcysteine decarboxylase/phosphopantothenate--cysteine ligase CoaBC [Desulfobacteraceae bacterium]|nr:bifunctional phosphopantothenoylcysteine decarboxylase/phosphopantothenate--cysteine ligase CoaBC [Desulfobacteraceae bacterium]
MGSTTSGSDILRDKKIVLGVSGGIAAYKSVLLLRLLIKQGAAVRVLMTENAGHFVGPLTFEALSGLKVHSSLFSDSDDAGIGHIEWAAEADAVIIAPATANVVGKLANGIADDALSTFLMAVTAPVVVCPAMNTNMYESRAVQRNLDILRKDGFKIIEPGAGELACGTTGPGKLPEPEEILDRFTAHLTTKDLRGKNILVTAGPTQEEIDPVRFISNPSSGKMGFALARAAEHRGARVTLVTGPSHLTDPFNVNTLRVTNTAEMAEAVFDNFGDMDVVIKSAAVSDYRVKAPSHQKMKKHKSEMVLELVKNNDILKALGQKKGNRILVGFAAETQDLENNAQAKLKAKNLDIIAANLIGPEDSGFRSDKNRLTLFFRDGSTEHLDTMEKNAAAHVLLDRVARLMPV